MAFDAMALEGITPESITPEAITLKGSRGPRENETWRPDATE